MRKNRPFLVKSGGVWRFVRNGKLAQSAENATLCNDNDIGEFLSRACGKSVYAYERQLASGFFTFDDGARLGLAGKTLETNGVSFASCTGVCIRIPHNVLAVAKTVFDIVGADNVIVLGRAGTGKTTFLRDLARLASMELNVLVADERGEIYLPDAFPKCCRVDVLSYADKSYCFECGIRALAPDVFVCDELFGKDFDGVRNTIDSGVKVFATMHASSFEGAANILKKNALKFAYAVMLPEKLGEKPELVEIDGNHQLL